MKRFATSVLVTLALGLTACAGTPSSTLPRGEPLPPTDPAAATPLETERTRPVRAPCPSLAACAPILHDIVRREWRMPPRQTMPGLETTLLVDVKPDGFIRSIKVSKSSGNGAFDNSAIRAVEKAQPFIELRNLPEVRKTGGTQLQFVFLPK